MAMATPLWGSHSLCRDYLVNWQYLFGEHLFAKNILKDGASTRPFRNGGVLLVEIRRATRSWGTKNLFVLEQFVLVHFFDVAIHRFFHLALVFFFWEFQVFYREEMR